MQDDFKQFMVTCWVSRVKGEVGLAWIVLPDELGEIAAWWAGDLSNPLRMQRSK